jgi:type 1 glutamine amidotransferase
MMAATYPLVWIARPGFTPTPVPRLRMKKLLLALLSCQLAAFAFAADKKIVLIAGAPSHGVGEHEHRAGMLLLQSCLADYPGIKVEVVSLTGTNWVPDPAVLNDAAAVIIYSDGQPGHPLLRDDRLQKMGELIAKGVGFGLMHYATEPSLTNGEKEFMAWTGGAFEVNYSINPIYRGEFKSLPPHPITRGVKPFATTDEWYSHIRFAEGMKGVTPILSLIVPETALNRPDKPVLGLREGNEDVWAAVRRREPQTVMWATERADGGRGFGFTGGHYHSNWANDDQRKLVLNAILWAAGVEVPAGGVVSKVTPAMLRANLDSKGGRGGAAVNPTLSALNGLVAQPRQLVTDTRRALTYAALTAGGDAAWLRQKAVELGEANLALAQARAALFTEIQASPDRFSPEEVATLVQAAGQ